MRGLRGWTLACVVFAGLSCNGPAGGPDAEAPRSTYLGGEPRQLTRLRPERAFVYVPGEAWAYSHHPYIASFGGQLVAIWSNGRRDEDAPGQRVVLSRSEDGQVWSEPEVLAQPRTDAEGVEFVLTAAGFHEHEGMLAAYIARYRQDKSETGLSVVTTRDGAEWTDAIDLGVAMSPNEGPRRLASGALLIPGHSAFARTDDRAGLGGWTMSGTYPAQWEGFEDNPATIWSVRERLVRAAPLCEASIIERDGVILAMLRATGDGFSGELWLTHSADDGRSWSEPEPTAFPDNDHKFQFGRMRDGRFFYLGCPDPMPRHRRSPLVLSLSSDGRVYDQHFVLADEPYERRYAGRSKGGQYGYPRLVEHDGQVWVIVSRQKEAIEVLWFPLAELDQR